MAIVRERPDPAIERPMLRHIFHLARAFVGPRSNGHSCFMPGGPKALSKREMANMLRDACNEYEAYEMSLVHVVPNIERAPDGSG